MRFPKDELQREAWKKAVGRMNFTPTYDSRLCEVSYSFDVIS